MEIINRFGNIKVIKVKLKKMTCIWKKLNINVLKCISENIQKIILMNIKRQ